jgi:hypothetical protein
VDVSGDPTGSSLGVWLVCAQRKAKTVAEDNPILMKAAAFCAANQHILKK